MKILKFTIISLVTTLTLILVTPTTAQAYQQLTNPANYSGTPINLGQSGLEFDKTTPFSVSFQMQRGNSIANECIVCKIQSSFFSQGWEVYTDGQLVIFQINGKNANDVNFQDMIRVRSAIYLDNGDQQNLLITYDGSGSAKGVVFQVNGTVIPVQITQDNIVSSGTNSYNVFLGSMSDSTYKFTGSVNNLTIYSGIYSNGNSQNRSLQESVLFSDHINTNETGSSIKQYSVNSIDQISTSDVVVSSSTTSVQSCPNGYTMTGVNFHSNQIICSQKPVAELQNGTMFCNDGYNTAYFGVGNCGKFRFLGIGTQYADDSLVIDGRMYKVPPSQPIDTRITISGVSGKAECMMFSDDEGNVPISHFYELFAMCEDNVSHVFFMGHYIPINATANLYNFVNDFQINQNGLLQLPISHSPDVFCSITRDSRTGSLSCN